MSWVPICRSVAVDVGQIVPIRDGGVDLVVWRGAMGRLCAMDARCPHQWSDLGTEGRIDGDEIVCTAHFWRFDHDGRGTKRNLLGRCDEKASVATYPVRERDGEIEVRLPTVP
jgi:phenylpropionate dioxygenase-like ring-hydroxylating dioxygenase large terminal subunit